MTKIVEPCKTKAGRWRDLIVEQKQSGLSIQAFCERHQLKHSSFRYWQAKFVDLIQPIQHSRFISVARQECRSAAPRILLPNGVSIDLNAGLDNPVVGAFLKSLCGVNGGPHAKP